MKKLNCFGLLLIATIGCGGQPASEAPQTASQNSPAPTTGSASVTNACNCSCSRRGGTEPGEVVALFLDSLRRGDETTANSVLTTQAQAELAKTDYVIEPLGTPKANTDRSRRLCRQRKDDGLVECTWSEPNPEPGQPPIEMELVLRSPQRTSWLAH